MSQPTKSPHRLVNREQDATALELRHFSKGDVFVREGTPCMIAGSPMGGDQVMVINLTNGTTWNASVHDMVYPAYNVELTYTTNRVR